MKITLLQGDIPSSDVEKNLQYWEQMLKTTPSDTQLVMLPETFNTGFMNHPAALAETEEGITLAWMKQQAQQRNTAMAGSFMVKSATEIFNRFYFVRPDGSFQHYDKRHLFRFGGEHEQLTAGKERVVIEYLGWKIFPLVCYDLRFPVFSYNRWTKSASYEYDLLLVCANWPSSRIKVWNTLLKARAIENQCFVVAVNRVGMDNNDICYNGHSQIVDEQGVVRCKAKNNQEMIITDILQLDKLQRFRKKFCTGRDQEDLLMING